jgi:serine/threonine protein phosphatase PrpC
MVPDHGVFIVADGMGGHAAGEVASEMAVQTVGRALEGLIGRPDAEAAEIIRKGIVDSNGAIFQRTLVEEQARTHPYSNVITRCVGANADVAPDIYGGTLHEGDLFLLASDGLTGMLEDEELSTLMVQGRPPGELVDRLIAEANRRGGLDNITVIVIRIDSVEVSEDQHAERAIA